MNISSSNCITCRGNVSFSLRCLQCGCPQGDATGCRKVEPWISRALSAWRINSLGDSTCRMISYRCAAEKLNDRPPTRPAKRQFWSGKNIDSLSESPKIGPKPLRLRAAPNANHLLNLPNSRSKIIPTSRAGRNPHQPAKPGKVVLR